MSKKAQSLAQQKAAIKARTAEKLAKLDAQIKAVQARERQKERKRDTRRKIIAGALALENLKRHPDSVFANEMAALIDEYVLKDTDRALFDLEPLPDDPDEQAENAN